MIRGHRLPQSIARFFSNFPTIVHTRKKYTRILSMKHYFLVALAACSTAYSMVLKKPLLHTHHGVKSGIVVYRPEYEKKILAIALKDITRLASTFTHTKKEYQNLLHENVVPTLHSKGITTLVFLKDGEPIGFITYAFSNPWYSRLMAKISPNAEIYHLAIQQSERKSGFGSALVRAALADCHDKSVNRVSLWVTASGLGLGDFYAHFGFRLVRQTKLFEQQYALRLQPHPIKRMVKDIFK